MKINIIKAREGSTLKVGDRVDIAAKEAFEMLEGGFAVTASEWDATQAVEAQQKATVKATEDRVDAAIARAKERGAIAPQADVATIRAKAIKLEQAVEGAGVETIDSVQAKQADPLAGRKTAPVKADDGFKFNRLERGEETLQEATEGVVKAREGHEQLCRKGNWDEAVAQSVEASRIMSTNHMKVLAKGGDFSFKDVVKAATTADPDTQVGSLAGDIVLMQNLGFLVNKLPWMKYLTTDLSGTPARYNQSILTRYITPPGVLKWVPGVGFTSDATTISNASSGTTQVGATQTSGTVTKSVPGATDKNVKMDRFQATEIEFAISRLAMTARSLLTEQIGAQTYSLAEAVNTDVLAGILSSTWSGIKTSYTTSAAAFNLSKMIGIKNAMTISKIPDVGRFLLLHSFLHDKMLEDSNLLNAKAILALINKDQSSFESSDLPTLFGVKPLESQLASATNAGVLTTWTDDQSPGTTVQVGFAGNMSSYLFVSRPPQDWTTTLTQLGIPVTASVRLVTEPVSGLTVMVFSYADNGKMSISQRVCLMWGHGQGDPRVGFPIVLG